MRVIIEIENSYGSCSLPKERYVLLGFGRASTLSWHYLDTQREDLLPWETSTNG